MTALRTFNALLASHRRKSAEATIDLLVEYGVLVELPSANGRLVRSLGGPIVSIAPSSSIWTEIDRKAVAR